MNNSIYLFPKPENEPVLGYAPGSPERTNIRKALDELYNTVTEIPAEASTLPQSQARQQQPQPVTTVTQQ